MCTLVGRENGENGGFAVNHACVHQFVEADKMEGKMATEKTKTITVRLPVETAENLKKISGDNLREFLEAIESGIVKGDIKYENGSVHGLSNEIEDPFGDIPDFDYDEYEYVHSILERIGSRVRVNSMRELADYLEKKFLGGY